VKIAIILFNLGGPDSLEAVQPFLRNLFGDPAILRVPGFIRRPLASFMARRRAPTARAIYDKIGGSSPILGQTEAQARALEEVLGGEHEWRGYVCMRYWHPMTEAVVRSVERFKPDRIVLLPLYPQYSTTTTASSLTDWAKAATKAGLSAPTSRACCYPWEPGFVAAAAAKIRDAAKDLRLGLSYRLLLSAHGLPKRVIQKGDPYQWQVEQSAAAIVKALGMPEFDPVVCYQSRVGPLEWIGPSTDAEITRAGKDGKGVIVAPIAFVSEHSETLVELDIEYRKLAAETGVPDYRRAATVGTHPDFIQGLAGLVACALDGKIVTCEEGRICPASHRRCGYL